jgi:hypothetical protein
LDWGIGGLDWEGERAHGNEAAIPQSIAQFEAREHQSSGRFDYSMTRLAGYPIRVKG